MIRTSGLHYSGFMCIKLIQFLDPALKTFYIILYTACFIFVLFHFYSSRKASTVLAGAWSGWVPIPP